MPIAFSDLPTDRRLALCEAIDAAGAEVDGYDGLAVQVMLPNPASPCLHKLKESGLVLEESHGYHLYHFPLGSDRVPEHMRHSVAKYGEGKGFGLYARLVLAE